MKAFLRRHAALLIAFAYILAFDVYLWHEVPQLLRADYYVVLDTLLNLARGNDWHGLISYIFEFQSGHLFVFYKLLAAINFHVFGFSLLLTKIVLIVLMTAYAAALAIVIHLEFGRGVKAAVLSALAVALLMNPHAWGAYLFSDTGVVIYSSGLFSFLALVAWRRWAMNRTLGGAVLPTALVCLAVTSSGGAFALLPALVLYEILRWRAVASRVHTPRKPLSLPSVLAVAVPVGLAVTIPVLMLGLGHAIGLQITERNIPAVVSQPLNALNVLTNLVGSPLTPTSFHRLHYAGIVLLVGFLALLVVGVRRRDETLAFWLAVAFFGLVAAVEITFARHVYFTHVYGFLPTKYTAYVFLISVGFLCAFVVAMRGRGATFATAALVLVMTACLVADGANMAYKGHKSAQDLYRQQTAAMDRNAGSAIRVTSWPNRLGEIYRQMLPELKEKNLARVITDRFIADGAELIRSLGVTRRQILEAPSSLDSHQCGGLADGALLLAERDVELNALGGKPRQRMIRFLGSMRDPDDCQSSPPYVFVANSAGDVICATRPNNMLFYMTGRELAPGDPFWEHSFDFDCALRPGHDIVDTYAVYAYVVGDRPVLRIDPLTPAAFLHHFGLAGPIMSTRAVDSRPVCSANDGQVLAIDPAADDRTVGKGFSSGKVARVVGKARNVDNCDYPVDYLLVTGAEGHLICVSRPAGYSQRHLPLPSLPPGTSLSRFSFDTDCRIPASDIGHLAVWSFAVRSRTLIRLELPQNPRTGNK